MSKYLNDVSLKLATFTQMLKIPSIMRTDKPYRDEVELIFAREDETVKLFRGVSTVYPGMPIVIKQHKYSIVPEIESEKPKALNRAINAALVQARVEHPYICKIMQIYLDTKKAPREYCLVHILQDLIGDTWMEIKKRQNMHRPYAEKEIWNFIKQISSAMAYAHSKVIHT